MSTFVPYHHLFLDRPASAFSDWTIALIATTPSRGLSLSSMPMPYGTSCRPPILHCNARTSRVNAKGGGEVTPLHVAVSVGHLNILSLLLEYGADVDAQDGLGQIPLRLMESSKPVNVYSIAVRLSMLKITIIGPLCSTRRSNDTSSLLEC